MDWKNNERPKKRPAVFEPMGEIAGYPVRPGLFHLNGAMALPEGVNFTVHTHEGTGCELLLFHRERRNPMRCCLSRRSTGWEMCTP